DNLWGLATQKQGFDARLDKHIHSKNHSPRHCRMDFLISGSLDTVSMAHSSKASSHLGVGLNFARLIGPYCSSAHKIGLPFTTSVGRSVGRCRIFAVLVTVANPFLNFIILQEEC
ncbi:unnamed protein product, partial [Owenia fusiformis]